MKNKKMQAQSVKVMADNINGIFTVSSFDDYDGCEILSAPDFWECLADCYHNKTIGAELDKKWFKKIADEYGIQQNFSG